MSICMTNIFEGNAQAELADQLITMCTTVQTQHVHLYRHCNLASFVDCTRTAISLALFDCTCLKEQMHNCWLLKSASGVVAAWAVFILQDKSLFERSKDNSLQLLGESNTLQI